MYIQIEHGRGRRLLCDEIQALLIPCLQDDDAEKINHRIPHRFEPLTNMGANWCCHCGYMLPLGRKNARKCSECDVTCHANCAHLVPDFCGMSMETANEILRNLRVIKKTRGGKPPTTGRPSPYSQGGSSFQSQALDSSATIVQGMGGMKLSGSEHLVGEHAGRPHSASIVSMDGRPPDGRPPQYQQYQPSQQTPTSHPAQLPPGARPPPGQQNVRMPVASPAHPSSQEMSQPPYDPHMQVSMVVSISAGSLIRVRRDLPLLNSLYHPSSINPTFLQLIMDLRSSLSRKLLTQAMRSLLTVSLSGKVPPPNSNKSHHRNNAQSAKSASTISISWLCWAKATSGRSCWRKRKRRTDCTRSRS